MTPALRFLHVRDRATSNVRVRIVPTSFTPDDRANAAAWREAKARLGDKLFDGPMCRFEGLDDGDDTLALAVSQTSYRRFVETNLYGPRELPESALARPVGVSAALETGDDYLVFGRRGDGVAYYPNRVHPFAGSLEWPDEAGGQIDVLAECRRELSEELSLLAADVPEVAVIGIAEDTDLRHPELILHARTPLPLAILRARLDPAEHESIVAVTATPEAVLAALGDADFTPVGRAALLLFGKEQFGATWFADRRRVVGV